MAHLHDVRDTDTHFIIDPISRSLTNPGSDKSSVFQYDHDSERITFEIPRYVDGHDMLEVNIVEVHYINLELPKRKNSNKDVYVVSDFGLADDDDQICIGSWLISRNATKYVGSLTFAIRFACTDSENSIVYQWFTGICTVLSVDQSIFNEAMITEDEKDIIAEWRHEIETSVGLCLDSVEDATLATESANKAATAANSIAKTIEDKLASGELKGEKGDKGDPGPPGIGVEYASESDIANMFI